MGLYRKFLNGRKSLVLLFLLVVAAALFALPFAPVSGSSTNTISLSNPETSLQINDTVNVKNYTSIVTDPSFTKTTIVYQGSSKTVVELPKESVVVKLPDNRLAINYESGETSILPAGKIGRAHV